MSRKLYQIEGVKDTSYLVVDGDYVINGDYYVESNDGFKTIRIARRHGMGGMKARFVADIPSKMTGDYNDIIFKMEKLLAKRR